MRKRKWVRVKTYIYCFYDVITLFQSVKGSCKYWQGCFNAVFSTSMNICWLSFPFQPNINIETTLGHKHWIGKILSTLLHCYFVNVETTLINIRRLNFLFKSNFNVETTLAQRRWINLILSSCFNVVLPILKQRR